MNTPRERFRADRERIRRHTMMVDSSFIDSCLDVALNELTWRGRKEDGPGVTALGYRIQGAMEFIEIFRGLSTEATEAQVGFTDPGALLPERDIAVKMPEQKKAS